MNRDDLVKQVEQMPLGDLAKQVVSGSYTDGIHNAVLIQRCIESEEFEQALISIEQLEGADGDEESILLDAMGYARQALVRKS